jgi:hypothetical protein
LSPVITPVELIDMTTSDAPAVPRRLLLEKVKSFFLVFIDVSS